MFVDKINEDICELCYQFLNLLESLREKGIISDHEFILHSKSKKLFIHQEKNKLSI